MSEKSEVSRKKRSSLDPELRAMNAVSAALGELEPVARIRVIHWAQARFCESPCSGPGVDVDSDVKGHEKF